MTFATALFNILSIYNVRKFCKKKKKEVQNGMFIFILNFLIKISNDWNEAPLTWFLTISFVQNRYCITLKKQTKTSIL